MQVGEAKYGKPILDRIIHHDTSMDDAVKCALVSMDSTIRSNVTVGPPIEIVTYPTDSLVMGKYWKLEAEDPYLVDLKTAWDEKLRQAFSEMPRLE
jgi:putative proteasome-type protease